MLRQKITRNKIYFLTIYIIYGVYNSVNSTMDINENEYLIMPENPKKEYDFP